MIEKIIYDFWNSESGEVPGYLQLPKELPSQYIRIEKTGSGEVNRLKRASIAIQSYADSLFDAMSLNEHVKTRMSNIEELDSIASCSCETDYNFTDSETKKYRYQAVFDIYYY